MIANGGKEVPGQGAAADFRAAVGDPGVPSDGVTWRGNEIASRLAGVFGRQVLLTDINIMGSGTAVATLDTGDTVRPILIGRPAVGEFGDSSYTVFQSEGDQFGRFGIGSLALAHSSMVTHDVDTVGPRRGLSRISEVSVLGSAAIGAGLDATYTNDVEVQFGEQGEDTFDWVVSTSYGGTSIAEARLVISENAPVYDPSSDIDPLLPVSAAIQAALLIQQHIESIDEVSPHTRLSSIREVEIRQSIRKGEPVTIEVFYAKGTKGFVVNADVIKEDGSVAQEIRGIRGTAEEVAA